MFSLKEVLMNPDWGKPLPPAACSNCVHSAPERRSRLAHVADVTVCRRRSPPPGGWPEVKPGDKCGEYERR